MKFKEKVCGNCGLDLTTAEPVRVREIDETMTLGECPQCHTNRIMVAPEPPKGSKPKAEKAKAESEPKAS